MTALHLTPVQTPAVHRCLVGGAEDLEMLATNRARRRGDDRESAEMREEAAMLREALEQLAGDQSPAPSRAHAHELAPGVFLEHLSDEELRAVIGAADELLDARFLETDRERRREVDARYCTSAKR